MRIRRKRAKQPVSFDDPTGRGPTAATLAVRGTVYLAVLGVVATLLLIRSTGTFHSFVSATAVVSSVGDGLDSGADVKLRGVLVGSVDAVEAEPGGEQHVIRLRIKPEHADGVPASVKARIVPTNVFGAPSVELVPREGDAHPLRPGATIPGDESQEALQLQTAISNVQKLLTTVEPGKLNATLTSIQQALDGRGGQIGSMIDRLEAYLGELNPQSDRFENLLSSAAKSLEAVEAAAPDLLTTVRDVLTTTRTIVDKRQEFVASLTAGGELLGTVDGFLRRNDERIITVLHTGSETLGALAIDPGAIPRSFRGLGKGVDALVGVFGEESGRLRIQTSFTLSPYKPYTAADCPRYGDLAGRNCGQGDQRPATSSQTRKRASAPTFGGTVGPVGSDHEAEQITDLLGDAADPAIRGLFAGPLLRGATVVTSP